MVVRLPSWRFLFLGPSSASVKLTHQIFLYNFSNSLLKLMVLLVHPKRLSKTRCDYLRRNGKPP